MHVRRGAVTSVVGPVSTGRIIVRMPYLHAVRQNDKKKKTSKSRVLDFCFTVRINLHGNTMGIWFANERERCNKKKKKWQLA
jgi:hypothetical protein